MSEEPLPDFEIRRLGEPRYPSPMHLSNQRGDNIVNFVPDDQRVLYDISLAQCERCVAGEVKPPTMAAFI